MRRWKRNPAGEEQKAKERNKEKAESENERREYDQARFIEEDVRGRACGDVRWSSVPDGTDDSEGSGAVAVFSTGVQ